MENQINDRELTDDMLLTNESRFFLLDIAKWARFLSIVGITFIGLTAFFLILSVIIISSTNTFMHFSNDYGYIYNPGTFKWLYLIFYLVILGIYFIPFFLLYKFSVLAKKGLTENNSLILTDGFRFLKNHYMFIGILTIIVVFFCLISFVMVLAGMYTTM